MHGQQIAFGQGQFTVLGEEIAGFADRADDVVFARSGVTRFDCGDVHPRLIQRRADQVVHRRVDDGEVFMFGVLEVLDLRQQHAGIGDDETARLEHQRQVTSVQALAHSLDVVGSQWRLFIAIAHAQTTTEIDVAQVNAAVAQTVDQIQQAIERIKERWQGGQLRTDVAVDTDHFQVRQMRGAHVHVFGVGDGDAELVLFETGRNVRVGAGIDVRVHAQRNRGANAQLGGDHLQALQLVGGFDVEAVHADFEGATHVVTGLADTGEDDLVSAAASGQNAFQLATGNDVETGTETGQDIQYAEVGVGLDRKADQVRHAGQSIGVSQILSFDMRAQYT